MPEICDDSKCTLIIYTSLDLGDEEGDHGNHDTVHRPVQWEGGSRIEREGHVGAGLGGTQRISAWPERKALGMACVGKSVPWSCPSGAGGGGVLRGH